MRDPSQRARLLVDGGAGKQDCSGKGGEGGVARGPGRGGEGRSAVSIIHTGVDEGRDPSRTSDLGPSRLPSIMLGATLTGRKGQPNESPVYGRLLSFLEGAVGWKEARNPNLSKTAVHPTV